MPQKKRREKNKQANIETVKHIIIIILVLIIVALLFIPETRGNNSQEKGVSSSSGLTDEIKSKVPVEEINNLSNQVISKDIIEPVSIPKPDYTPTLRKYEIDKSHDIWHAKDPSSYITPENVWVRYYANHTREVQVQYVPDEDAYPHNYDKDVWQNADYTLSIMQGDCEDEAIVWVSIHRAMGHKAIVVGGELWFNDGSPNIRDYWYEWIDEFGNKNTMFVAPITQQKEFKAVPIYMFNDKINWRRYNANWYN